MQHKKHVNSIIVFLVGLITNIIWSKNIIKKTMSLKKDSVNI